jgi:hypothetical protein
MRFLVALSATVCAALAADPALTIYNADFAVVRQSVPLKLEEGLNMVSFSDATAMLEPDSVILRDPAGKVALQILEQNYRNDPISQRRLLALFEGKTIEFQIDRDGEEPEMVAGKIIRSGYQPNQREREDDPIVEVNGKLQFELPGRPLFPALGDDTVLKPTLLWQINAPQAAQLDAELAYVTAGFKWKADYNLVAPEQGDTMDFVGWITMENTSGKTFANARIKLMAGDVHKVQPPPVPMDATRGGMVALAAASEAAVEEKAFDEYHLYTLPRPATLRDQETKQVEFSRAAGVKAQRLYVYDGAPRFPGVPEPLLDPGYGLSEGNRKVAVYVEFQNSEANRLGIPLPAGRMRLYRRDGEQLEFVGENEIDHTPKDETIRLFLGNAFDLVGERTRTNFVVNQKKRTADESFEIKLRNRSQRPATVRVVEHLYRWTGWEIAAQSQEFERKDAQTIECRVAVQPDTEKIITYTVHYAW